MAPMGITSEDFESKIDETINRIRASGGAPARQPCPSGCGGYKVKANSCTYCSNHESINPKSVIKCEWSVCDA
jgi:hypothetical protein